MLKSPPFIDDFIRWSPYGSASGSKCIICKQQLHQEAKYCQNCAYKKGEVQRHIFLSACFGIVFSSHGRIAGIWGKDKCCSIVMVWHEEKKKMQKTPRGTRLDACPCSPSSGMWVSIWFLFFTFSHHISAIVAFEPFLFYRGCVQEFVLCAVNKYWTLQYTSNLPCSCLPVYKTIVCIYLGREGTNEPN